MFLNSVWCTGNSTSLVKASAAVLASEGLGGGFRTWGCALVPGSVLVPEDAEVGKGGSGLQGVLGSGTWTRANSS